MTSAAKPIVRRNPAETRARILAAAQRLFSTVGYTQTGLRDIAAEARVDMALVSRAFGSKEKLFEAALDQRLSARRMWADDRDRFGVNLVASMLDPQHVAENPLPMMLLSVSDPGARAIAITLMEKNLVRPLGALLGDPDGEARAAEILALTAGFFAYSDILPLSALSDKLRPSTRHWLASAIQSIVDEGRMPKTG
jgi:AcrR family transcriptional regulator